MLADKSGILCIEEKIMLKRTHAHYYQVQVQMLVCGRKHCVFAIWTPRDYFCERIYADTDFWTDVIGQCGRFFRQVLLPEVCYRFWTMQKHEELQTNEKENIDEGVDQAETFCLCGGPESDDMVMCDSKMCKEKWFHFDCVGLKAPPKSKKWFCSSCRPAKKCKQ